MCEIKVPRCAELNLQSLVTKFEIAQNQAQSPGFQFDSTLTAHCTQTTQQPGHSPPLQEELVWGDRDGAGELGLTLPIPHSL